MVPLRRSDRGPAEFFHGRQNELALFQEIRDEVRLDDKGTILLIQGPPGSGKTALLHEFSVQAESDKTPWKVAEIFAPMLHNSAELAEVLGLSYAAKTTDLKDTTTSFGASYLVGASRERTVGQQLKRPGHSVHNVLREAAEPDGLILILDEAQNIPLEVRPGSSESNALVTCLNRINNGKIGAPIILVAGGLGTTEDIFDSLGISRLEWRNVAQLGELDDESTRNIIHDWLVKSGGAPVDHEHLRHWIEALTEKTFGWPQHIQCFAIAAAKWLLFNGHKLTPEVPREVIAEGLKCTAKYYKSRTSKLKRKDIVALANFLKETGKSNPLDEDDLIRVLSRSRTKKEAEVKLDELMQKGVIAENPDRELIVPVPSMHDWMVRKFADPTPALPPKSADEQLQARDTLRSQRD